MNEPVLELQDISHTYQQGNHKLEILKGISLSVYPGEMVALVGASGSGKSTLLHLAGLLELPTQGHIKVLGKTVSASDEARTAIRAKTMGFVYQFHHLMPEFSALDNVAIPQMIAGASSSEAKKRALHLLERMGLADRAHHRPSQLSGGEQQRVAIVRALANQPPLLLADEPTGNLDEETAQTVFNELVTFVKEQALATIIVTHDRHLAQRMDRVLTLQHGLLVSG